MALACLAAMVGLALTGSAYAQETKSGEKKDTAAKKPAPTLQAETPSQKKRQ